MRTMYILLFLEYKINYQGRMIKLCYKPITDSQRFGRLLPFLDDGDFLNNEAISLF